jgi:glycosyltransferase involved in cell wall biosynthesis
LLIPDRVVGWFPYATRSGVRLISKYRPKAIYSSSPPETAHVIALYLSRKFNIPWIADFRDPWTQFEFSRNRLYPFIKIERYLEKIVLESTSNVLTVTEECKDSFLSLYPWLDKQKFHVIPNGYDEEDFRQVKPKEFDKLTIIFTGRLYQQTPPAEIFKALNFALQEKSEMQGKCQFLFIGNQYVTFSKLVKKWCLEGIVQTIPYQEHQECLSYLLGSDICYYNFSTDNPNNKPLHHSAKLYEYLRSGTFIFAVIPEYLPVSKIINKANAGVVVDPQNIEKMRNELLSLFEIYLKKNKIPKRSSKVLDISNFDRKSHTQKLANLLNKYKKR